MADRQQNIRIKFTTDTAELDKAKNAAQQAQAATDKLKQSAGDLGKNFAAGARQSVQSLESMNLQLARLKAQISLTTDPKLLQRLSTQYKELKVQVDNTTKSLYNQATATKNLKTQTDSLTGSFGGLMNTVRLFLAAGLLQQTLSIGLEMAKLAGNVEGVKRAFDRLPGSVLLLQRLRDATQGTVTDFELMQRSLQARNFRIPLEQLASLFQFATVRAQQTGQSVDYLINSIVFGLGFQSIRRLDNVGISAAELRDVMKELGVSLNEAFNIVVQREIEKMGGLLKTTATEAEIFNARLEELRQTLAKKISQGGFLEFMSLGLVRLKNIVDSFPIEKWYKIINPFTGINLLREWNAEFQETVRAQENMKTAASDLAAIMDGLGRSQREQADGIIQEVIQRKEQIRLLTTALEKKQAEAKLNELQNSNMAGYQRFYENRDRINREIRAIGNSLQVNKIIVDELVKSLHGLTTEVVNELGLIEAKKKEIEATELAIDTAQSRREIHDLSNELSILKGELADLEAFGTTKQFLMVGGELRLVPVVAPKDAPKGSGIELGKKGGRQATDQFEQMVKDLIGDMRFSIPIPLEPTVITPMDGWDKLEKYFQDNSQRISDGLLDITANRIQAELMMEADAISEQIRMKREFYDEQQMLAGDNERHKSQLRLREERELKELNRQRADREKQAALAGILVNTAVAIIKALSVYDYAGAAFAAIEGGLQYGVAENARYYAKGKVNIDGPGTSTSDSIPARLSKGESVIKADSTQRSLKLLEGINAGKIDDRILEKLHVTKEGVKVMKQDNSDIVDAIRRQPVQDLTKIGSEIYEVKTMQDGFSKRLRRKSMTK